MDLPNSGIVAFHMCLDMPTNQADVDCSPSKIVRYLSTIHICRLKRVNTAHALTVIEQTK